MFPARTSEAGKAAARAGRRPLLQISVPDCLGKAVRGRKDGEGATAGRG